MSVRIPGNGFNLAGTLSQPSGPPPTESKGRYPAVVLVGPDGEVDLLREAETFVSMTERERLPERLH